MEFLQANAGNIIVGSIVFIILALAVIRLILNARRGKNPCGCEICAKCAKRATQVSIE
jgi:hypothetical protein